MHELKKIEKKISFSTIFESEQKFNFQKAEIEEKFQQILSKFPNTHDLWIDGNIIYRKGITYIDVTITIFIKAQKENIAELSKNFIELEEVIKKMYC